MCPTSPLLGKTWADLYVGPAFRAAPDLQHEGHDHDHEDDQHRDGAADEQERVLVALALLGPTVLGGLLAVLPRLAVLLRGLAVGLLLPVLLVLLLAALPELLLSVPLLLALLTVGLLVLLLLRLTAELLLLGLAEALLLPVLLAGLLLAAGRLLGLLSPLLLEIGRAHV